MYLFCIINGSRFPYHIYFDLTRVFELCFYLLGNLPCQENDLLIVDFFRFGDYPYLSSCLYGK